MVVSLHRVLSPFWDLEKYPAECKKVQGGVVCSYPVVPHLQLPGGTVQEAAGKEIVSQTG